MTAEQEQDYPAKTVRVTVLGATGSIGQSVADLIARNPDRFEVVALVANSSADALAEMALRLNAKSAVLCDPRNFEDLKNRLSGSGIDTASGDQAVFEAVDRDTDLVIGAIVGAAGLLPTMAAIKPGRRIALANKECLVCAGDLFMGKIAAEDAEILPVDSEHNAIFQVFEASHPDSIEKVILTASGGPFRTMAFEDMVRVTPQQALKHPNWDMGARISIDSATMMNKGLEVIEAHHLFPVSADQLDVLVHPQSAVHGLVQYRDGSLLAQLGSPDMRTPIAHCMAYPRRMQTPVERLDLAKLGSLTFEAPDMKRFPALRIALEALRSGGTAPAVLNAADETAVAAFLKGAIGFMDIPAAVEEALSAFSAKGKLAPAATVEDVLALDQEARVWTGHWISSRAA
ncbi:1-deoxy-D-xylulose 5-phosphate reductoisomerase [Roseibium alexandrii DFL-11]|uniref:1-deoxy-D-xylulose 5-phosphate reductoisomerase n=1 Tax=Roseibium alexandrii (strain DSM 17067 / NCIMB 14079 / DFL-11) TaxID=244592 RepID=A0A5E8H587_ROSAD|nr:1-deoxy-D-xylulose 5-phosphate reductoisomerase [Roseibium alexandrii DFL-11]